MTPEDAKLVNPTVKNPGLEDYSHRLKMASISGTSNDGRIKPIWLENYVTDKGSDSLRSVTRTILALTAFVLLCLLLNVSCPAT